MSTVRMDFDYAKRLEGSKQTKDSKPKCWKLEGGGSFKSPPLSAFQHDKVHCLSTSNAQL